MRFNTLFFAMAGALASTRAMAGWLKDSPGSSYADYCNAGGSKYHDHHVCFKATRAFLNRLELDKSDFEGYIAPNGQDFVVIQHDVSTYLETKFWDIGIGFATIGTPGAADPGCVNIAIQNHDPQAVPRVQTVVCRGDSFTMPNWV